MDEKTNDKDKKIKETEEHVTYIYKLITKPFIILMLFMSIAETIYYSIAYGFSLSMLWNICSRFLISVWVVNVLISAMASFISIVTYYKDRLTAKRMLLLFCGMLPVIALCMIPYFGYLISVKLYHKVITKNWDKKES